jgi:Kef-type K+ transport system membrane component KefB
MDHLSVLSRFALLMALVIAVPKLFERMKLPGLLGFILIGVLAGPQAFGFVNPDSPIVHLFSDLGKLLFMFFVGFEVDLAEFKKSRGQSFGFGLLTFILPLALGVLVARLNGYGWNASILIGSLLASHTLLAFPLIQKLGLASHPAIMAVIGGTIFTDIAAMLVLALCLNIHTQGFSWLFLGTELVEIAIYVPVVLFGVGSITRKLLVRYGQNAESRVIILMLAIVVAAEGAELIRLEGIVGAFLAGIAVRRSCRGKFAIEQLEITAQALFVPAFFVSTGFLLDFNAMSVSLTREPWLVLGLLLALGFGKWTAAGAYQKIAGLTATERRTVWSLSTPQMAATLAAAVVAHRALDQEGQPLIDVPVINAVLLLVMTTCVIGPVLTARFAKTLKQESIQG